MDGQCSDEGDGVASERIPTVIVLVLTIGASPNEVAVREETTQKLISGDLHHHESLYARRDSFNDCHGAANRCWYDSIVNHDSNLEGQRHEGEDS